MHATLRLLVVASLLASSCGKQQTGEVPPADGGALREAGSKDKSWPAWNGTETVAAYALRAGVEPALRLDLGNRIELDLALVPAGSFLMGSPVTDEGRRVDRPRHGPGPIDTEPLHRVTLTRAFYMGKHEVTRAQYAQVLRGRPADLGGRFPETGMNWTQAQEFCRVVAARTGRAVRLPTEAEWEFACRAGTGTRFCSGDTVDDLRKVGWASYDGKSGSSERFKPVGSFLPNAWGLCDMHGNAEEWCQDWQGSYPEAPVVDPSGPAKGVCRIVRGGSGSARPEQCRSAYRDWGPPDLTTYCATGFRVVVEFTASSPRPGELERQR
jgi:formylglycine-generating enzyme required for sulfatase activity